MLEQQQAWLVNGLQELYRRSLEGEGWPGEALKTEPNGHPLTHDLLTRLGALDHTKDHFEEHPDSMQHDLWRNGMQRQESSDGGSSEAAHSPARSRFSSDAFSQSQSQSQQMPPTPPAYSPSRAHIKPEQPLNQAQQHQQHQQQQQQQQQQQYALSMQGVVNPLALQGQGPQSWNAGAGGGGFNPFDEMDLMSSADYSMKFEDSMPSPMFNQMPLNCVGGDYDDFNQFLNPNPTEITSI